MTVREAYEQRYGANAKMILRSFGIDPDPTIDEAEANFANYDPTIYQLMGKPLPTAEDFAEAAYWEIVKAIKAAYFGNLPRAEAEAIVTTLRKLWGATITLCNEEQMTYNDSTFAHAWEAAHPDEPRLCPIDWDAVMP